MNLMKCLNSERFLIASSLSGLSGLLLDSFYILSIFFLHSISSALALFQILKSNGSVAFHDLEMFCLSRIHFPSL